MITCAVEASTRRRGVAREGTAVPVGACCGAHSRNAACLHTCMYIAAGSSRSLVIRRAGARVQCSGGTCPQVFPNAVALRPSPCPCAASTGARRSGRRGAATGSRAALRWQGRSRWKCWLGACGGCHDGSRWLVGGIMCGKCTLLPGGRVCTPEQAAESSGHQATAPVGRAGDVWARAKEFRHLCQQPRGVLPCRQVLRLR